MVKSPALQKIVMFSENKGDIDKITQSMNDGWAIVKLLPHGNYFIGIMEKMRHDLNIPNDERTIFIPSSTKVKFNP